MINPLQSVDYNTKRFQLLNLPQCSAICSFDNLFKYNKARIQEYFTVKEVLISQKQVSYTKTPICKVKLKFTKSLFLKTNKAHPVRTMKETLHFTIQRNK